MLGNTTKQLGKVNRECRHGQNSGHRWDYRNYTRNYWKYEKFEINISLKKAWDEIEIEDELSGGGVGDGAEGEPSDETAPNLSAAKKYANTQSFKSKLSVPLVCSTHIQSILFTLCQELTKNLSYPMIEYAFSEFNLTIWGFNS